MRLTTVLWFFFLSVLRLYLDPIQSQLIYTLKGGVKINGFARFALFNAFMMYRNAMSSKYEYAPYLLEDEGGVFTIGYNTNGWFEETDYWKTYQSGPKSGQKKPMNQSDFNYWKDEAHALWGYVDFWGNFIPGLLNPELPEIMPNNQI